VALYEDEDGFRREQVRERPNTSTNREELGHEQVREYIREQPNTSMIVEEVWHEQVREQVREQLNAGRSWREEVREQIRGPVRERLDDRAAARVQSLDTERPPSTDDEPVLVMNGGLCVCDV